LHQTRNGVLRQSVVCGPSVNSILSVGRDGKYQANDYQDGIGSQSNEIPFDVLKRFQQSVVCIFKNDLPTIKKNTLPLLLEKKLWVKI
jgi:hypothetical protein